MNILLNQGLDSEDAFSSLCGQVRSYVAQHPLVSERTISASFSGVSRAYVHSALASLRHAYRASGKAGGLRLQDGLYVADEPIHF